MSDIGQEATMSDGDFAKLRAIVHQSTGITIGDTRKSMLVSRLRRRLREVNAPSYAAYISRLKTDADEMQEFTDRVTTNETYFYRTPRVWEHFEETFLPGFVAHQKGRRLKVWSAASSTGEEAYTAGVICENQRRAISGFDYEILGTDVSSRVVEIASCGTYKGRPVARFQKERPELFDVHMNGNDVEGYSASPAIKARVKFKLHNLLTHLKDGACFDVVFLRNVLIYFTSEDQEAILSNVRDVIAPDGVLYIGESETLNSLKTGFEQIAPIIYQPSAKSGALCA